MSKKENKQFHKRQKQHNVKTEVVPPNNSDREWTNYQPRRRAIPIAPLGMIRRAVNRGSNPRNYEDWSTDSHFRQVMYYKQNNPKADSCGSNTESSFVFWLHSFITRICKYLKFGNGMPRNITYSDVLDQLLDMAVRRGDLDSKYYVDVSAADRYVDSIGNDLDRRIQDIEKGKKYTDDQRFFVITKFAMYAGMGFATDILTCRNLLQGDVLFDCITEGRNILDMDVCVLERFCDLRFEPNSVKYPNELSKTINAGIMDYTVGINDFVNDRIGNLDKNKVSELKSTSIKEVAKGCFIFGITLAFKWTLGS